MYRLFGLVLLGSTALWPVTALAQDAEADVERTLAWQEMNDCQRLAALAQMKPDQAPIGLEDARNLEAQNDLASCTQAVGEMDQLEFSEFQQEYEAAFAGQSPTGAGDEATGEATITVQQAAPEVTVHAPQVTVTQAPPQIIIRQQAPTITIQQPQPEIIVRIPELSVDVDVEEAQVSVQEPDAAVSVAEQAQPSITYEEIGEPQILFEMAEGEPQVTFEQVSVADSAAAGQTSPATHPQAGDQLATGEADDGVQGQQEAGDQLADAERQSPEAGQASALSETTEVAASDIIGREVVNEEGQSVGQLQAIVELQDGRLAGVLVADEFLGIGERQYAIPLDNLTLAADALVVIDLADQDLVQSAEWDQSLAARDLTAEDMIQIRVWQMPEGEQQE
jgi:sporulation protein YlmC with PRC-barrel domain